MKVQLFTLSLILFSLFTKAQTNYTGKWEVYDTLSIETTRLGNMTLNKVKLYHKELHLLENGTFKLTHIEPKGFYINANIEGVWEKDVDGILLKYKSEFEDEKGVKSLKAVEEKLLYVDEFTLQVQVDEKLFDYQKK